MIRISHLIKSYGTDSAMDDVSLNIGRNEVVSIIGYSGSGKSTLMKCIAGLEPYDSGSIVTGATPKRSYPGIGMVFSGSNLFPHMTVLQNLMLAPMKVLGMSRKQAEEEAIQILEKVGIWSARDAYPDALSSGQRQRAAIARATLMCPKVLLADEPTGNLDEKTGARVVEVLRGLNRDMGMTLIIVTHNQELAASLDRSLELRSGELYAENSI